MEPVARLSTGQSVTSYEDDGETDAYATGPVPRVSTGQSWTSEDSEGGGGHNPLASLKGIAVDAFDEREEEDVATAAAAATNSADGSLSVPTALPNDACVRAADQYGTPLYLYSAAMITARAEEALAFPAP